MARSDFIKVNQKMGWWESGEPWVWLTAAMMATSILAVAGILLLITFNGLTQFWPQTIYQITYQDEGRQQVFAQLVDHETLPVQQYAESAGQILQLDERTSHISRELLKSGNRQLQPPDYRWVFSQQITQRTVPVAVLAVERLAWGTAYGEPVSLLLGAANTLVTDPTLLLDRVQFQIERATALREQVEDLEQGRMRQLSRALANATAADQGNAPATISSLNNQLRRTETERQILLQELNQDLLTLRLADGQFLEIPVAQIVRVWQPNRMSWEQKLLHFLSGLMAFLLEDPREANTEGGIFPAIFGTILMVLLMSVLVTPFGVIAAVYLHEYARPGMFVNAIRVAVNNLAGVPSIVYGVFGLGFFVYFLGGNLDELFYSETLPAPTFGTPGLLWASLTLALLTMPVVIVSTEEGLARIPSSLREGSFALGATQAETLFRIILPMASPAILTGIILAIARAAGEVAPLMLVGVVKLAPSLPVDATFPYIHLDQKFMHLGFHIYNVGFQTSNIEAARPVVYATALLLVLIIVALNLTAILLRKRLEGRYRGIET